VKHTHMTGHSADDDTLVTREVTHAHNDGATPHVHDRVMPEVIMDFETGEVIVPTEKEDSGKYRQIWFGDE
jgi:hypothetical protein